MEMTHISSSRPAKRQKRATKTRRVEDSEDDEVQQ